MLKYNLKVSQTEHFLQCIFRYIWIISPLLTFTKLLELFYPSDSLPSLLEVTVTDDYDPSDPLSVAHTKHKFQIPNGAHMYACLRWAVSIDSHDESLSALCPDSETAACEPQLKLRRSTARSSHPTC